MTEETKVATTEAPGVVAAYQDPAGAINPKNLIVPKILLMQPPSQFVQEEKARLGEMRDSMNCVKLGTKEEPLEILPFFVTETWVIYEQIGDKLKFKKQVPQTPENVDWDWTGVEDGVNIRRDHAINYFCLLPIEIENEDVYFPYLISFRRTSHMAGKKLETARAKYGAFGLPVYHKTYNLSSLAKENDHGKFYVYDVVENRKTTDKEKQAIKRWENIIRTTNVEVDHSDLEQETGHTETAGEYKEGDKF